MRDASQEDSVPDGQPWRSSLEELERTLQEVGRALGALRVELEASDSDAAHTALRVVAPDSSDAVLGDPEGSAQPVADTGEADVEEHAPVTKAPEPTEFQKVWERHKTERGSVGDPEDKSLDVQEAEASFDLSADEESPAEAEASHPTGFEEVWERLGKTQGATGSREDGGADAPLADPAGVPGASASNFERVWERLHREREDRSEEGVEAATTRRGLGSLLKEYRMTVEDRDGTPVDLVPLHRALMAFAAPDDISLMGYAKGTAIVGLRTEGELDLDRLASVIGTATARQCEVIPQDQGKLFLRLSGDEEREE